MSRKYKLRGFAISLAQMFATSSEHFAFLALQHRAPLVSIDLKTGEILPPLFDIPRNRTLVGLCMKSLERIFTKVCPVSLISATLQVDFGFENVEIRDRYSLIDVEYTVTLIDDAGREIKGSYGPVRHHTAP